MLENKTCDVFDATSVRYWIFGTCFGLRLPLTSAPSDGGTWMVSAVNKWCRHHVNNGEIGRNLFIYGKANKKLLLMSTDRDKIKYYQQYAEFSVWRPEKSVTHLFSVKMNNETRNFRLLSFGISYSELNIN